MADEQKPSLRFIVHRYYALLYPSVTLIALGSFSQNLEHGVAHMLGLAAAYGALGVAHRVQINWITPKTLAEYTEEN